MAAHLPTVLLVHHDRTQWSRLHELLQRGGLRVCGEVCTPSAAVARLETRPCDLLLLDADAVGDVVRATREVHRRRLAHVVILLPDPERPLIEYVLAGADGLLDASHPEGLVPALRGVLRGEAAMSRALTRQLLREGRARAALHYARESGPGRCLTPRELEVLEMLHHGMSTREVADALCVEPVTVRSHLSMALRALGVHSKAEALALLVAEAGGADERSA